MNKKIIIILDNISSHWWIQKIWVRQAELLSKNWYNVDLLIMNKVVHELKYKSGKIHYLDSLNIGKSDIFTKIYVYFYRAYLIKKIIKKYWYHIAIWHWWDSWIPTLISRLFIHEAILLYWQHSSTEKMNIFWKILYLFFFPLANYIISVSKEDLYYLKNIFFWIKKKFHYINNFYDNSLLSNWVHKNLSLNWKITFLHIWALEVYKNQELMLQSFIEVSNIYKNCQLIIIWTWSLEKFFLKNYQNNNIHFIWYKENPEYYIEKADCILMSSIYEWMPLVLINSLCLWKPIISSIFKTWIKELLFHKLIDLDFKNNELWFYISKNGIITNNNITNFRDAIIYFLENKNTFNVDMNFYKKEYSEIKHVKKIISLIN